MKKIITILCVVLMLITLAGCSTQASSQKSEEELRAEIKGEMEAEAKKDQGQNDKQESEQKPEQKPENEQDTLKTFEDVYDGNHLTPVIEYFDQNYDGFSEDMKKEFAQKIVDKIREQMYQIYEPIIMSLPYEEYVPEDGSIPVNLNGDQYLLETLKDLENTELLTLAMRYWASSTDGVYHDQFKLTIHPDIAQKLKKALDIIYPNEVPEYYSLDPIFIPNVHYTSMDKPFNSFEAVEKGYAQVYIEDPAQLKLFDNENVWKTTLVLPVKINYFGGEERIKELKLSSPINDDFLNNYTLQVVGDSLNITYNSKTETLIKAEEFYMTNYPEEPAPYNKRESSFYVERAEKDGAKIYFYEITKEGGDGELKYYIDLETMEIFYVEWKAL